MLYTVGEVAKVLGVAPSTLRYYDREGLLPFVERTSGGFRMFSDKDLEWLAVIECLKQAGVTIKEIQSYIAQCAQGDETIPQRKALLAKRREAVLEQMHKLQSSLDMLDYKLWFYSVAEEAGTTSVHDNMPDSEIPPRMLDIKLNCRYYQIKRQAQILRDNKARKNAVQQEQAKNHSSHHSSYDHGETSRTESVAKQDPVEVSL